MNKELNTKKLTVITIITLICLLLFSIMELIFVPYVKITTLDTLALLDIEDKDDILNYKLLNNEGNKYTYQVVEENRALNYNIEIICDKYRVNEDTFTLEGDYTVNKNVVELASWC